MSMARDVRRTLDTEVPMCRALWRWGWALYLLLKRRGGLFR